MHRVAFTATEVSLLVHRRPAPARAVEEEPETAVSEMGAAASDPTKFAPPYARARRW
jgi:hypothetical protein